MTSTLPYPVAIAARDPKSATTAALAQGVQFIDDIDEEDYTLMVEEYARRGGTLDALGVDYVAPEY